MAKLLEYQRALGRLGYTLREIKALGEFVTGRVASETDCMRKLELNELAAIAFFVVVRQASDALAELETEFEASSPPTDDAMRARAQQLLASARNFLVEQYPQHSWDFLIGADVPTLPEPPPVTFKPDRRLTSFVVDARRVGP